MRVVALIKLSSETQQKCENVLIGCSTYMGLFLAYPTLNTGEGVKRFGCFLIKLIYVLIFINFHSCHAHKHTHTHL